MDECRHLADSHTHENGCPRGRTGRDAVLHTIPPMEGEGTIIHLDGERYSHTASGILRPLADLLCQTD